MKGYDSINRYCGRLENRLKNTENKDAIIAEIRGHLLEQTGAYLADGCVPEIAELLAIEDMGPAEKLADSLRGLNAQLKETTPDSPAMWEFYTLISPVQYSALSVMSANLLNIRHYDTAGYVLMFICISLIWIFLRLTGLDYGLIKCLSAAAVPAIAAFALWIKSLDRYRPFITPLNTAVLAALAVLTAAFYRLAELLFYDFGHWMLESWLIAPMTCPPLYYAGKLAVTALLLLHTAPVLREDNEGRIFILICAAAALLPLPAVFFGPALLLVYFPAVLVFIGAASVYVTTRCKNKYRVRTLLQLLGMVGCAEILTIYALKIMS